MWYGTAGSWTAQRGAARRSTRTQLFAHLAAVHAVSHHLRAGYRPVSCCEAGRRVVLAGGICVPASTSQQQSQPTSAPMYPSLPLPAPLSLRIHLPSWESSMKPSPSITKEITTATATILRITIGAFRPRLCRSSSRRGAGAGWGMPCCSDPTEPSSSAIVYGLPSPGWPLHFD